MSAKLVPTFADGGCRVVSATDPHGRILGFLDRIYTHIYAQIPIERTDFRVPVEARIFLYVVQTGSGAHRASYPMGDGGLFLRV
jgi:hypothetical protein